MNELHTQPKAQYILTHQVVMAPHIFWSTVPKFFYIDVSNVLKLAACSSISIIQITASANKKLFILCDHLAEIHGML
jgi:hypothetical protein